MEIFLNVELCAHNITSSFESEEEALKKLLKERFEPLLWFHENGNKDIKNYSGFFERMKEMTEGGIYWTSQK